MVGISYKGAMSQSKRPSHQELFDIWLSAIRGNDQAKRDLFNIQTRFPETRVQLAGFARQRARDGAQKAKDLGLKKAPRKQSEWQKASNTVTKSGASFVAGGLPTLGKRR